jgi:hypothetical protein
MGIMGYIIEGKGCPFFPPFFGFWSFFVLNIPIFSPIIHNRSLGGCRNWSRRSGPQNLDQIWTKSGPNLDTIWTGFLKTDAEIPDKILRPRTRESLLKIVANKKVCEIRIAVA